MKRTSSAVASFLVLGILLLVFEGTAVSESATTQITVDGDPGDWAGYEVLLTDPIGDHRGGGFDIATVRAFTNDQSLYVLIETHGSREDYVQVDLEIRSSERKFVVSFRPEEGWPASMGDVTSGAYQSLGEVSRSVCAAAQAVEFKMPLSALGDAASVATGFLQLVNVRPMGGTCCAPGAWYGIDNIWPVQVPRVNEIEAELSPEAARYAPGSVAVIERSFDMTVRGDEPVDIVVSPDGRRAYTTGRNTDNLFVIDLATNQIVEVIDLYPTTPHPLGPAPEQLAITPDGTRLLVTNANDGSVTVVDAISVAVVATLAAGRGVADVAISPDGRVAYVPNQGDTTLTVIDVPAARVLTTVRFRDGGGPFAAAFAPDGSRAYVALQSGLIAIIDPSNHRVVGSFATPPIGWTGDLVISPDGKTGYVNSVDEGAVLMLDLEGRRVANTFELALAIGLALSADGNRLYVGTFGFLGHSPYNVFLLDAHTGDLIAGKKYKHPAPYNRVISDIQGLALSPDGDALYFVTVDGDGVVVADPATLEARGVVLLNPIAEYLPVRADISPDGSRLYVVSGTRRPTTVHVIDTRTHAVIAEIVSDRTACEKTGIGMGSFGLAVSPDGRALYVLATDECVLKVDTQTRAIADAWPIRGVQGLVHLAVHPNGDTAYVLAGNANVYMMNLSSGSVSRTIPTGVARAYTIKLSPDATRAYVTGDFGYAVLDLTTGTVLVSVDYSKEGEFGTIHGRALGVHPDGSQYIVATHFNFHVYDSASHREIRNIDLFGWDPSRPLVRDIAFGPDGRTGYAAMWDGKAVFAFDATTWRVTASIDTGREPYFGVCPTWLVMSPDGGMLYVVNEEGDNVLIIDTATNRVVDAVNLSDR